MRLVTHSEAAPSNTSGLEESFHMLMRHFAIPCMLLTASLVSWPARCAHAGPLIDWLFHRPAYGPAVPVGSPYPVTAGYVPSAAGYAPYATGYAPYTTVTRPTPQAMRPIAPAIQVTRGTQATHLTAWLTRAPVTARLPATSPRRAVIRCQPMARIMVAPVP